VQVLHRVVQDGQPGSAQQFLRRCEGLVDPGGDGLLGVVPGDLGRDGEHAADGGFDADEPAIGEPGEPAAQVVDRARADHPGGDDDLALGQHGGHVVGDRAGAHLDQAACPHPAGVEPDVALPGGPPGPDDGDGPRRGGVDADRDGLALGQVRDGLAEPVDQAGGGLGVQPGVLQIGDQVLPGGPDGVGGQ
jgi:hypothetical protein